MAGDAGNVDLGDFETKVDQMAAMLNQLQEAGRQNEAVAKLKQLMNTLVKVCPETIHAEITEGATDADNPESIVTSILHELVDQVVGVLPAKRYPAKVKRATRGRPRKVPLGTASTRTKASIKSAPQPQSSATLRIPRKRGRPPKHLQAALRAERARRKEFLENSEEGPYLRGRKRKNPNPQKLLSPDEDSGEEVEDEFSDMHTEQSDVTYLCEWCKEFNTKSVSRYVRHMRLHGEAILSCLNCRKEMFSAEEFERHQCAKPGFKAEVPVLKKRLSLCCDQCSTIFISRKKFKEHMKLQHNVVPPEASLKLTHTCKFCQKDFNRKQSLLFHLKEHAGDKLVCVKCGEFCDGFEEYTAHMGKHDEAANFSCDKCGSSFLRRQQFEQHLMAHERHDCSLCKRKFSTKKALAKHEREEHGTKVPWEHKFHDCKVCGKTFPRPGMLEVHMRIHTGEKPLECSTCKLFFRTPKALSKHRQTFTHMQKTGNTGKERRYLCSLCGKAYFRRQALLRHQKYHTGEKPYKCPHCEYRCPEANNLKRHMLLHFTAQRSFMCEICGSSFHAKKTLEMHNIYKHSDIREYPCSECSMSFKAANALRRHMRSHSTDKPFACWCGAAFNRQYNLRRHMKSVHGTDEALPPVRKVAVLDTPPEVLAAKAESEKEAANKVKGKRGRKNKNLTSLAAAPQILSQHIPQVLSQHIPTHSQPIILPPPPQGTLEMTDQELRDHVIANLPRVIDDHTMVSIQIQHSDHHMQQPEVHIHHVETHHIQQHPEIHHMQQHPDTRIQHIDHTQVQHPEVEDPPPHVLSQVQLPSHVIVSSAAPDSHIMTSSPITRPVSVPHPGYAVTTSHSQQQMHIPIAIPAHVITSQHVQMEEHLSRSGTPTSQPCHMPMSAVRQLPVSVGNLVQDRPMSHPSAQTIPHHHPQLHAHLHQHAHLIPHHQSTSHLQQQHHHPQAGYPEVTYADTEPKQMVLLPSIAQGTEVASAQEEQFLAKAEQAAMENMTQYQPGTGSTGYTGLPILLHHINTSN